MSKLLDMKRRHQNEIDALQEGCKHTNIKMLRDSSVVGDGSLYPSHHIICRDCGKKKIIFVRNEKESKRKPKKTVLKEGGWVDERVGLTAHYDYELEGR